MTAVKTTKAQRAALATEYSQRIETASATYSTSLAARRQLAALRNTAPANIVRDVEDRERVAAERSEYAQGVAIGMDLVLKALGLDGSDLLGISDRVDALLASVAQS